MAREALAAGEERGQADVERLAGAKLDIFDGLRGAAVADLVEERVQRVEVALPQGAGVTRQPLGQLQPLEPRRAAEREVEFVIVEHVQ